MEKLMSSQGQKVAVICGALRDTLEFSYIADRLLRERAAGRLDRIILSTWAGELTRDHHLFGLIASSGVEVVETTSPATGGHGNIHRQKKALFQALLQLPDDATVLKLRTDKCAVLLNPFLQRWQAPLIAADGAGYHDKVVVVRTSSTLPFMSDDFAFMGRCSDLLRMTAHEESLRIINPHCDPTAEMLWMYAALARQDAYLDTFFSMASPRVFSVLLKNAARNGVDKVPEPVLAFLGHYWKFSAAHYEIVRQAPVDFGIDPVSEVLRPLPGTGSSRDIGPYITVHGEGALAQAALALAPLREAMLKLNPVDAVLALGVLDGDKGTVVRNKTQLSTVNTLEAANVESESFLTAALRNHRFAPTDAEELRRLEHIMNRDGGRIAFPRLLSDIGVMYKNGLNALPQDEERARAWLRFAAAMREPFAFRQLVESYPSDQAAIAEPEVQRLFALQEARDPELFARLARAFLVHGMTSAYLEAGNLVRTLRALALQNSANGSAAVLEELKLAGGA
jgi:hypothetical protein